MRIRKCDRCNEVYEPYEDTFNSVGISTFNIEDEEKGNGVYYDLCPKCQAELLAWLTAHGTKIDY